MNAVVELAEKPAPRKRDVPSELTVTEAMMIRLWRERRDKLAVSGLFGFMYLTTNVKHMTDTRREVAEAIGVSEDDIDAYYEANRDEVEAAMLQKSLDYYKVDQTKAIEPMSQKDKAKVERAIGAARARLQTQAAKAVGAEIAKQRTAFDEKVESEVLKRLPDEERRYIKEMRDAIAKSRDIWGSMKHVHVLYKAFKPFFDNEKVMMRALHPDLAPAERKEEFGEAMGVYNSVRSALANLNSVERGLLSIIWPQKGK